MPFLHLTLTLTQQESKDMHWATLRRHSCLELLLLCLVLGWRGPLLNPGTSQCSACSGVHW